LHNEVPREIARLGGETSLSPSHRLSAVRTEGMAFIPARCLAQHLGEPLLQEVIPVKKRIYRKVPVKRVSAERVLSALEAEHVVFAIDVAKTDMVAASVPPRGGGDGGVEAPEENRWCWRCRRARAAGVAVEP
jgi:hypothetical protein